MDITPLQCCNAYRVYLVSLKTYLSLLYILKTRTCCLCVVSKNNVYILQPLMSKTELNIFNAIDYFFHIRQYNYILFFLSSHTLVSISYIPHEKACLGQII